MYFLKKIKEFNFWKLYGAILVVFFSPLLVLSPTSLLEMCFLKKIKEFNFWKLYGAILSSLL